jgi:predicted membrane protein
MAAVILFALIALILFGVGFTVHLLWWIAVVAAVIWLLGFVAHGGHSRWYYW